MILESLGNLFSQGYLHNWYGILVDQPFVKSEAWQLVGDEGSHLVVIVLHAMSL